MMNDIGRTDRSGRKPSLSLVIPVYNETENIAAFHARVAPILDGCAPSWEMLFVDDGSRDKTAAILRELHRRDPRVKALLLSRNFGKECATTAGLEHVSGDAVIPIDVDMQDPPELIPDMVAKWQKGYDVVLATRRSRGADSWAKRTLARWFYRWMGAMARVRIPENTGDFRLMDRKVVEAVRRMPERTRFMKGVFAWVGFSTARLFFDRPARRAGDSKWNFIKLWNLALDGMFSFTTLPLKIWTYIGSVISLLAFIFALAIVIRTLILGASVPGYASLITVVLFMGGIQLIGLGILGEYIARIYRETKQRPIYIVAETIGV